MSSRTPLGDIGLCLHVFFLLPFIPEPRELHPPFCSWCSGNTLKSNIGRKNGEKFKQPVVSAVHSPRVDVSHKRDQLYVVEYAQEIMDYLRNTESKHWPSQNYMGMVHVTISCQRSTGTWNAELCLPQRDKMTSTRRCERFWSTGWLTCI